MLDGETIGPVAVSAVQFMAGASEMLQMAEALVVQKFCRLQRKGSAVSRLPWAANNQIDPRIGNQVLRQNN